MPFPVEEKFILRAENLLNVKFPDSYRTKMSNDNGGAVEVGEDIFYLYPIYDDSDRKRIGRTINSVVKETEYQRSNGLSKDVIAIGDNQGGDLLVFKINKSGHIDEKIFWIDHEVQELELVVNSFSELNESM